jgi:deoxyribodipyrimidine photo-lyase
MANLFWFRRDLRVQDNAGLYHALKMGKTYCVFIFDTDILDSLKADDKRLPFLYEAIENLKLSLQNLGSDLIIQYGQAQNIIPQLAHELNVECVYSNEDYEPLAIARDDYVKGALSHIEFKQFKDSVIFSKKEILTDSKQIYSVFTHYKNKWLKTIEPFYYKSYPTEKYFSNLIKPQNAELIEHISLHDMGFEAAKNVKLQASEEKAKKIFKQFCQKKIKDYTDNRNYPSIDGTSFLSVYLRFGLISIREMVAHLYQLGIKSGIDTWLSELIWREFYMQILFNYPAVIHKAFKSEYDSLQWSQDKTLFKLWCEGKTGYPIVDAAMAQINQTGFMHNRLRMVVASFLTKDLQLDYKLGEAYFAEKLIDYELSSNNGGWQWSASTGCDAQPYFRIFNPTSQSKSYDKDALFIKKWVPELKHISSKYLHEPWEYEKEIQNEGVVLGVDYPKRIVKHDEARKKALALFEQVKNGTVNNDRDEDE